MKELNQLNDDAVNGTNVPEDYDDAVLDEVLEENLDELDVKLAREGDELEPVLEGLLNLTLSDLIEAQKDDIFCQTIVSRQDQVKYSLFFEDKQELLRRIHHTDPFCT